MTKSQLIGLLGARNTELGPLDVEAAVKSLLDSMAQTLSTGNRIEIRGFGTFGLNYRPPREGRNPKTGEKVRVAHKYVPHFKAGKELRERVDRKLPIKQRAYDLIVAATALEYDLIVVSSNTKDYQDIAGLRQFEPRTGQLMMH